MRLPRQMKLITLVVVTYLFDLGDSKTRANVLERYNLRFSDSKGLDLQSRRIPGRDVEGILKHRPNHFQMPTSTGGLNCYYCNLFMGGGPQGSQRPHGESGSYPPDSQLTPVLLPGLGSILPSLGLGSLLPGLGIPNLLPGVGTGQLLPGLGQIGGTIGLVPYPNGTGRPQYPYNKFKLDLDMNDLESNVKTEFPTLVSVQRENGDLCSGTIINNKFILTAAHCFVDARDRFDSNVRGLGIVLEARQNRTTSSEEEQTDNRISVENICVHHFYDGSDPKVGHDIAVVEVKDSSRFHEYVKEASEKYSEQRMKRTGSKNATIVGHGLLSSTNGDSSEESIQDSSLLRMSPVTIYPRDACEGFNGPRGSVMCAMTNDICSLKAKPDGILLNCLDDSSSSVDACGLASYGMSCNTKASSEGRIGVFTKISHYSQWISGVVVGDYSNCRNH